VPDPTSAENLLAVSGRGIMLMRTFMDSVEFNEQGNAVTLTKANPDIAAVAGEPAADDDDSQ
jgi:serine/threonine-protein kinase RsbW